MEKETNVNMGELRQQVCKRDTTGFLDVLILTHLPLFGGGGELAEQKLTGLVVGSLL